ncbi:exodeoxyribonuclease III [Marinicauda salina]|uniref:Exodeoxyribonuclease III n=1 Tax=Marinicauda salina TaxID=2135793 RepID=A0A2U2BWI3_9PROT|nr:exodeoxyribonuclease III [Marinicauda salina]PWE18339.1 exodeoxyribonuclease III [Marinicauda salina]
MSGLTLATWNINSVRLRAPQIAKWAEAADPDVICLQEIKCQEDQFPYKAFEAMGYPHAHVTGQKGMHGVATVSRLPIEPLDDQGLCAKSEARHQRLKIDGVEIQNYYIPAGGDEPDPEANPRFAHKLDFLDRLAAYFGERAKDDADIVAVGDFNIAPYENDVWSHKQLLKVVSHTPVETEGLERVRSAGDFIDVARALIPEPEKVFTWWSYRNRDWRKSNRGRRLDHIWTTPSLREAALAGGRDAFRVWDETRDWEKPSDHAPVTLTLAG